MKKATELEQMPDEIDFSNAERGRYKDRVAKGATMVMLEPDVMEVFPDSDAVNTALRMVMRAGAHSEGETAEERRTSK